MGDKQWQWRIVGNPPNARVVIAYDSTEVRRVLAQEDAHEEDVDRLMQEASPQARLKLTQDMALHPERYPSTRSAFLEAMAKMPGFTVPAKSYCKVIQHSHSGCGPSHLETAAFVLVEIISGPSRGKQGWVCETRVHQLFP